MIKNKKDCEEFLENREAFHDFYGWKAFTYYCYSETYGWNCQTRITFRDDGWYVFSWGQGWNDIQSTPKTYEEMIDYVWQDRKFINKELKFH